jgi:hypothetical protein
LRTRPSLLEDSPESRSSDRERPTRHARLVYPRRSFRGRAARWPAGVRPGRFRGQSFESNHWAKFKVGKPCIRSSAAKSDYGRCAVAPQQHRRRPFRGVASGFRPDAFLSEHGSDRAPDLAHRAEKWTRFSAPDDALFTTSEHRIDPKSGIHFWVRCSRDATAGRSRRTQGRRPVSSGTAGDRGRIHRDRA